MALFPYIEACYAHLATLKCIDGYQFIKWGFTLFYKGEMQNSRTRDSCTYDESRTTKTLINKLTAVLHIAFQMVYEIATSKKGISNIAWGERDVLQQITAWVFRQKVVEAIFSSEHYPLTKHVHVGDFVIGTPQVGEQGRSVSKEKVRVLLAMEYQDLKPRRCYTMVIEGFSPDSLILIFGSQMNPSARVETDGWRGNRTLKEWHSGIEQILSDMGMKFKIIIFKLPNFKIWLRGIYFYSASNYLQKYIEEYYYRLNRGQQHTYYTANLLRRMVDSKPITCQMIK